jgi:hypothetical protein
LLGFDERADGFHIHYGNQDECGSAPQIEITPQKPKTVILNLDKFNENVTLLLRVCQVAVDRSQCCLRNRRASSETSDILAGRRWFFFKNFGNASLLLLQYNYRGERKQAQSRD